MIKWGERKFKKNQNIYPNQIKRINVKINA